MNPDDKLFCETAVALGLVTTDQVHLAQEAQRVDAAISQMRPIDGYFVEQKFVTSDQVEAIWKKAKPRVDEPVQSLNAAPPVIPSPRKSLWSSPLVVLPLFLAISGGIVYGAYAIGDAEHESQKAAEEAVKAAAQSELKQLMGAGRWSEAVSKCDALTSGVRDQLESECSSATTNAALGEARGFVDQAQSATDRATLDGVRDSQRALEAANASLSKVSAAGGSDARTLSDRIAILTAKNAALLNSPTLKRQVAKEEHQAQLAAAREERELEANGSCADVLRAKKYDMDECVSRRCDRYAVGAAREDLGAHTRCMDDCASQIGGRYARCYSELLAAASGR